MSLPSSRRPPILRSRSLGPATRRPNSAATRSAITGSTTSTLPSTCPTSRGHGVGAALLSVAVINVIRTGALPDTDLCDPSQVLASLNEAFQMERHNNMYFTIWYGVYNKNTRVPASRLRWSLPLSCSAAEKMALMYSRRFARQE